MSRQSTQLEKLQEFFSKNPNRDVNYSEVIEWATQAYPERTAKRNHDPDIIVRHLYQQGWLIKLKKDVYKYVPNAEIHHTTFDFTLHQKMQILERDDFTCVWCGFGVKEGREVYVDYIMPREIGGLIEIVNGYTLCSVHYENLGNGKNEFIRLLKLAKESQDTEMIAFYEEVLRVYYKHNIDDQFDWE
jgi:hypothetical protein